MQPTDESKHRQRDWKNELKNHFENVRLLEKCQGETLNNFDQFCEFIAETAFENLQAELAPYDVRSRFEKSRNSSIQFDICFPGTKNVQFQYKIVLPKNSVELKLKILIRGRNRPNNEFQSNEKDFMPGKEPKEVLKLNKEDLILDIIEHYRDFAYEALTSQD